MINERGLFRDYWFNPSLALLRCVEGRLIADVLDRLDPVCALDAGCGSGRFTRCLNHMFDTGLDSDVGKLEAAQQCGCFKHLICDTFENIDQRLTAKFDFILLNSVLEHVIDPSLALGALGRLCGPGGHILLSVPLAPAEERWQAGSDSANAGRLRSLFNTFLSHRHYFSVDIIHELASRNGLKVQDTWSYMNYNTKRAVDAMCAFNMRPHELALSIFANDIVSLQQSLGDFSLELFYPLIEQDGSEGQGTHIMALLERQEK